MSANSTCTLIVYSTKISSSTMYHCLPIKIPNKQIWTMYYCLKKTKEKFPFLSSHVALLLYLPLKSQSFLWCHRNKTRYPSVLLPSLDRECAVRWAAKSHFAPKECQRAWVGVAHSRIDPTCQLPHPHFPPHLVSLTLPERERESTLCKSIF